MNIIHEFLKKSRELRIFIHSIRIFSGFHKIASSKTGLLVHLP